MAAPKVTVLLPVYNGEKYIALAVRSVLDQNFRDYEFLIINDGSTDKTAEVLAGFSDARIRIINNPQNLKLIASLNLGLQQARGEYIARIDADDQCLPQRLYRQVAFLDAHPDIGMLGGAIRVLGDKTQDIRNVHSGSDQIKCRLLFGNPVNHPTVMMRNSVLQKHNLTYNPDYPHAEDYELWKRLFRVTDVENFQVPLVLYRSHHEQVSVKFNALQLQSTQKIHASLLAELNIETDNSILELHRRIFTGDFEPSQQFLDAIESYLHLIYNANTSAHYFDQTTLRNVIGEEWFKICNATASKGFRSQQIYRKSEMSKWHTPSFVFRCKFMLKKFIKPDSKKINRT